MIQKEYGKYLLACDGFCGTEVSDLENWHAVTSFLKTHQWTTKRFDGAHQHYCFDCWKDVITNGGGNYDAT
ncbi:MAG: hypothetical protein FWB93_03305 [Oscillospiraceae bacterium]|nr:hypothetical protein [Oscillospiraceae bacterium]